MVSLGDDVLRTVGIYCRDNGAILDDVCDEALRGYLKKKGQPVTRHDALKQSAKMIAANDRADKPKKRSRRK